jgi:hypothetical protein
MKILSLFTLFFSISLMAQDYIEGEDMIYEDSGYVEESPSFARERDPAGYDDYQAEDEFFNRQEEVYDEEPVFEDSEDAYYAEEELLSP